MCTSAKPRKLLRSFYVALIVPLTIGCKDYNGNLSGTFAVTDDGTASYIVPLELPPGRAGVEPHLAIAYNSGHGNGWLGVGWSLHGLSEIRRCRRTYAQDGGVGEVTFTDMGVAALCLDGMRLIKVNTGTCPPDAVAEYRTERESFSRVCRFAAIGDSPERFTVWMKDGRIRRYGGSGSSAQVSHRGRLAWALSREEDRDGNYISYEYGSSGFDAAIEDGVTANGNEDSDLDTDFLNQPPSGPTYYPKRISYTGHSDLETQRHVDFIYSRRPDGQVGYFAGVRVARAGLLKRIVAYGPNDEPIRSYRLDYASDGSTGFIVRSIGDDSLEKTGAGNSHPGKVADLPIGTSGVQAP